MHSAMMERQNSRVRISACIASIEYTAGGGIDAVPACKKKHNKINKIDTLLSISQTSIAEQLSKSGELFAFQIGLLGPGTGSCCTNGEVFPLQ